MSRPRILALTALCLCVGLAPTFSRADEPVRVAAAADLKFAMDELVARYRQVRPSTVVLPAYGSSGLFFAQLSNGAPFDLFLSADAAYPRKLVADGVAMAGTEFPYAIGRIVLWVRKDSALGIEAGGLQSLAGAEVKRIAIANPLHAPYGKAAEAALKSRGLFELVKPKLVFGENAAQTAQFAQAGAVDAAIIPLSLASAPTLAAEGRYWLIPMEAHPPLEQVGVRIKGSASAEEARRFAEFLGGPEARAVLTRFGFLLPGR